MTLRGLVDGAIDQRRAGAIARSFRGTRKVRNELSIATTRLDSERVGAPSEATDPAGDENPSTSGSSTLYNTR